MKHICAKFAGTQESGDADAKDSFDVATGAPLSSMPTIGQLEEQIYVVEGFRARLTPFDGKRKSFPSYDFHVMAPQRWRVSEWKTIRLAAYVALLRDATPLRGDGTPVRRDLQLGNLRDSYYEAQYGDLAATPPAQAENVVAFTRAPARD